MSTKTINTPKLSRIGAILSVRAAEGEDGSRAIDVSFSSEEPYERFFGFEILDHEKKSVNLDFLGSGNAPLLLDHDPTKQIGVIEKAEIGADRRGMATVRFGRSALADEVFKDVEDGIRRNISVGYRINEMETTDAIGGTDAFRVTDWSPLEVSLVSVPADHSVGVGRSDGPSDFETVIHTKEGSIMDPKDTPSPVAVPAPAPVPAAVAPAAPVVDEDKIRRDAQANELGRVTNIMTIATKHNLRDFGDKAIADGKSFAEFQGMLLEKLGDATPLNKPLNDLDLSAKDKQGYSLTRAIHAAAKQDWSKAGFELECSKAIESNLGNQAKGFYMPTDLDGFGPSQQRDLTVGTDTAGGFLKPTDHLGGSYIEALRARLVLRGLGATMLSGLRGDVSIPAANAVTTHYWVAENGAPTEGAPTFRQVALSPKTIAGYVDMSRRLLQQSDPSIEGLIRADLIRGAAVAIDAVGINGGDSNQPVGILQTSGIGSVAMGTNGATPDWASIVDLASEVAIDNADMGSLAYLTNPQVKGTLAQTAKVASTDARMLLEAPYNSLYGNKLEITNGVPSTLDKGTSTGVASAMIFGNFADLILAEWGVIDVLVNPYTLSTTGATRVTVFQDVDVAVRHAESFAAVQDYLTA